MKTLTKKKWILFGVIALALALIAAALLLFWPKKGPNPRTLLAEADTLSVENICLAALLERELENDALWRQLLENHRALEADPLTLLAAEQAAEAALGALPEVDPPAAAPEAAGSLYSAGGLAQGGALLNHYEGALSLATDGETVYLAKEDGLYVDYYGLQIKLSPAKAERMIAAENGLYYLNRSAKRVQYIARDGHKTLTLSPIEALDFAYWDETLWIVGTDGTLYKDGTKLETAPLKSISRAKDGLYGALTDGGIIAIHRDGTSETLLSSPASALIGGDDGCLYYLNENGYPCHYDPSQKEAVILIEKKALAVDEDDGKVYYLNEENQLKKQ